MTRTITLTLTDGQYRALQAALEAPLDSPARDVAGQLADVWDAQPDWRPEWVPVPPNTLLAAGRALRTAARSAATADGDTWREIADRLDRRLDRHRPR